MRKGKAYEIVVKCVKAIENWYEPEYPMEMIVVPLTVLESFCVSTK